MSNGSITATTLSGIKCATVVCVCPALSSIIFRIAPEGCLSKKEKDASNKLTNPIFLILVSTLNPNKCESISAIK